MAILDASDEIQLRLDRREGGEGPLSHRLRNLEVLLKCNVVPTDSNSDSHILYTCQYSSLQLV